jgi:hypothetical protein
MESLSLFNSTAKDRMANKVSLLKETILSRFDFTDEYELEIDEGLVILNN